MSTAYVTDPCAPRRWPVGVNSDWSLAPGWIARGGLGLTSPLARSTDATTKPFWVLLATLKLQLIMGKLLLERRCSCAAPRRLHDGIFPVYYKSGLTDLGGGSQSDRAEGGQSDRRSGGQSDRCGDPRPWR